MSKKLNRIKCAKCNTICTSRHVHDLVSCECGSVSCDGGNDYCRYVGNSEDILIFVNRKWVPINDVLETKFEKPEKCAVLDDTVFQTAVKITLLPYQMLWDFIKGMFKK